MSKEIIVDGVDVSKCETIDNNSGWCGFWEEHCSKNPDCIHKKYYRKEQECEKAKEFANAKITQCANLIKQLNETHEQLDQLKVENEELNKTITNLENIRDEFSVKLNQLKAENDTLFKAICEQCKHLELYMKYKQALAEIREIAESCGWNFGNEILYKRIEQILKKIKECEGDNE